MSILQANSRITPAEAASILGVCVPTMRRVFVKAGRLTEIVVTPRRRFFERAAVEALLTTACETTSGLA